MEILNQSPTLVINEKIQAMWAQGKDVLHLGFGESRFPVHPRLKRALVEGADNRSYLPSIGTQNLRKLIAEYYSKKLSKSINENQILIGVGSKSLLFSLMHTIEGDILLPQPAWVSYSSMAAISNKSIIQFQLNRQQNFDLDLTLLESSYQTGIESGLDPKILILNSPNNPIGNSFSDHQLERVCKWAQQKDITILSDEIYSLVMHLGSTHTSPSTFYPEKTIIFSGLSKHLSLGGYRFGISILPDNEFGKTLTNQFKSIAGSIWSCVPSPIQVMAETAFKGYSEVESYLETCTNIHSIRTQYVYQLLTKLHIDCTSPTGGFYVYVSFKKFEESLKTLSINSCTDLANYLLDTYEISTLPGSAFGDDPSYYCLRISTSYLDMESDKCAQQVLENFEKSDNQLTFMKTYHPRTNLFLSRMGEFISSLN